MISIPIAAGDSLDAMVDNIGARAFYHDADRHPEQYMTRPGVPFLIRNPEVGAPEIIADNLRRPRVVDRFPHPYIGADRLKNIRLPDHLFRAISEYDWQTIQYLGYVASDGRMNLIATEGTVASFDDPSFYLPGKLASDPVGNYFGRIIRLRYTDDDDWHIDRYDGYAKTQKQIPLVRIDCISPLIVTCVTEKNGYARFVTQFAHQTKG